jgi:hypothetical protein
LLKNRLKSVIVASNQNRDVNINQKEKFNFKLLCRNTPNTTRINPRVVLPTSPINIFAFGQFQHKKPPIENPNQTKIFIPVKYQRTNAIEMASIEAYPSLPSKKLKRLVNQTNPTSANKDQIHFMLLKNNP